MMRNTNTISLTVHLKCKFDQHISMPLTTYFSLNAPQLQHKTTNRTRRNWWRHEKIKSQADKLKKAMTTTPNVLQQLEIVVIETKNFWQPFSRRQSCSEKEKLYMLMYINNLSFSPFFRWEEPRRIFRFHKKNPVYGGLFTLQCIWHLFPGLCCRFVPYLHTEEGRRCFANANHKNIKEHLAKVDRWTTAASSIPNDFVQASTWATSIIMRKLLNNISSNIRVSF